MEKSNILSILEKRIGDLEKTLTNNKKKNSGKKPDEDVCPECGNDLLFVEDGIVYCSKCKQYYDLGEE